MQISVYSEEAAFVCDKTILTTMDGIILKFDTTLYNSP